MDSSNGTQVLSISYGAFSITLEGFGDPFPIMKRVTEYFRQIAISDKGFGTLPIEDQHMEMGAFAEKLRDEGTGAELNNSQLRLTPQNLAKEPQVWDRAEGQIQFDAPANTAAEPDIIPTPEITDEPAAPEPTASEIAARYAIENQKSIAAQKQAEADALASAITSAKNSVERDEEIQRRLEIIREQTLGVSEKYDAEDHYDVGYSFLAQEKQIEDDELVFIHPLRSRFKRLKLQNGEQQMTGTDGTRLKLSPEMRTIKMTR